MLNKYLILAAAVLMFNTGIVFAQESDSNVAPITEETSNETLDIQNEAADDEASLEVQEEE